MVVSWGLGGGVEPGSQSAAPGIWVTAADSGRFAVGGLQVIHRAPKFARPTPRLVPAKRSARPQVGVPGLARGGTSVQTGSSLKLSTGTLLWNGGSRVPRHEEGGVSLYSLLFGRHPDEPTKPISTAPSGVRYNTAFRHSKRLHAWLPSFARDCHDRDAPAHTRASPSAGRRYLPLSSVRWWRMQAGEVRGVIASDCAVPAASESAPKEPRPSAGVGMTPCCQGHGLAVLHL